MGSSVQERPAVVAVVLTWNDTEMTAKCLESLMRNDYENLHVILVDNGSSTPCGEALKEQFPKVDLLVLPKNRGFTGGSNAGIKRALERNPRYVHLIGNDSTFARDAISHLVAGLEEQEDVGGASPLILFPGEDRIVQYYWGTIDRDFASSARFELGVPHDSRSWPTRETGFVPFIAVMFRAEALREVGDFDERLGTCWEDFDMILRLKDANWRLITVGDAEVAHAASMTTGRRSPYITYFKSRNRLICLLRYARLRKTLRRPIYLLRTFWWSFRLNGWSLSCHAAYARGILDFLLGVRGEGHPPTNRKG